MTRSLDDVKASVVGPAADEPGRGQKSIATMLVERAQAKYRLGVSEDGEAFAIAKAGPPVALLMRGGKASLRGELARGHFAEHGRVAPQQALADALVTLEGIAQEATPARLWQRVAEHEGAVWLDLGDATGRAVRIAGGSWSLETRPPVMFKRTPLTGALPEPGIGAQVDDLWSWLNVTPNDRPLILAFIVAALVPDIPHPVLGLFGEQGVGKTTTAKVIVMLIDPGPVPYRKGPRDAEAWVTAAAGSWFVALDNVSTMPDWLSDLLCRAVTGEGDVRRRLYTDGELATFAFKRVIALTGIDLGALNGDLTDRLLPVTLDAIPETARRDETGMWRAWRDAHPLALGAVLDLAAKVLDVLPSVRLDRSPRMVDFARIVAAVDEVLGTDGMQRYLGAQGRLAADSLTGDAFVSRVMELVSTEFEGTSADLLELVTPADESGRRPKDWPSNARAVTQRLRRQAPVMRKAGWHVSDDRGANKTNAVRWAIAPPPEMPRDVASPDSPRSLARPARPRQGELSGEPAPALDSPPEFDSPVTRQASIVLDAETSQASQTSQNHSQSRAPLGDRAAPLAAELNSLDLEDLRQRYASARPHASHAPDWWADTARTEPLAVTIALELLANDEVTGEIEGNPHAYLAAARTAVNGQTP